MTDRVKLAIVGCGGISGAHVNGYKNLVERGCKEFEIVACCDPNDAAAETRAGEIAAFQGSKPKVFNDIRRLIDSRLAVAADICTPHCFHHSSAIPLLDAGLHVMVEKPIGITVKASKKIIAAGVRNKRIVATAENVRRDLPARAATWAVRDAKLIGDIMAADVQAFANNPLPIEKPLFKWRAIKLLTGGGMIMDSGAHFTDMMLVLFGTPDEVSCEMRTYDDREVTDLPRLGKAKHDVENYWHAVLKFDKGPVVHWSFCNMAVPVVEKSAVYYGRNGSIADNGWPFHPFQGGGTITLPDKSTISREQLQIRYLMQLPAEHKQQLFPYGATDGFSIEVWDFVNAVATGRKPEMDGVAGLRAKALSEACYESATLGKPVKYNDVLEGVVESYQKPIDEYWEI